MSPSSSAITDGGDDMQDMVFAKRGCCFWIPCLTSSSSTAASTTVTTGWWERMGSPENKERWWLRGWKRIREWSEVVAGPKWKTFIRRFNRNNPRVAAFSKPGSFRYDPLSYALNFDNDNDNNYTGFSSRFGSLPPSAKSSMDLGKDGPSFT